MKIRSGFQHLWEEGLKFILQGGSPNFEKLQPKSSQEFRMQDHLRAIAFIHEGKLEPAKDLLLNALEKYGENIECLRDLACCYYQMGEISHWRRSYQKLFASLQELDAKLSLKTRTDCWIILAKFLEEEGHINKALEIYRKYYVKLKAYPEYSNLYYKILVQRLRLESQLASPQDIGALYTELIGLDQNDLSRDLNIEVQHGLMTAEMTLVGPAHAWVRVEKILEQKSLNKADKSLILYDYVEDLLLRNSPLSSSLTGWIKKIPGQDGFETELRKILLQPQGFELDHLSLLASELSWASYLRLLILWASKKKNSSEFNELQNKINLILSSLDPFSRAFWIRRFRKVTGLEETKLIYNSSKKVLEFQEQVLPIAKKKGMQLLVQILGEETSVGTEALIHKLWNSDYSPEGYHRLRMTVHRLNKHIYDLTSVAKAIEITAEEVSLSRELKLELH